MGTYAATVLSPSEAWEAWRVDEPYVFQRNDGKWILIYMADQARAVEQVGYASADDILGPYVKHPGNPVLAFGPPGSFDAGTIADPWVVEFHGVYYIGYTVSPTTSSPWQTAYATTSDWLTFTKHGVMFPLASSGWDSVNSFRGAVTRVGDTYVFPYTGDSYQMGIATQPVYVAEPFNDPGEVFSFFDGFDGTGLDSGKWSVTDSRAPRRPPTITRRRGRTRMGKKCFYWKGLRVLGSTKTGKPIAIPQSPIERTGTSREMGKLSVRSRNYLYEIKVHTSVSPRSTLTVGGNSDLDIGPQGVLNLTVLQWQAMAVGLSVGPDGLGDLSWCEDDDQKLTVTGVTPPGAYPGTGIVQYSGSGFTPTAGEKVLLRNKPTGHGFGLSTSYRIITLHGGTIVADSELGRGATFRVVLPVGQPQGV